MLTREIAVQQFSSPRRRLRVAVVTETYPPEINGVAMTLGLMVKALQAREHQVQLIRPRQHAADFPPQEENLEQILRPGVPIPRYAGLKMGLPAKSALHRLWSLRRPDVVHVATEGPLGWSAVAVANKLRIPVASDFHTNFHSYSRHYGFGWLKKPVMSYLRRLHNQSRVTLVPSQSIRRDLEAAGYRNVEVVARGVDTQLFDPARRDRHLRREWGVEDGGLAVLHVGRLAPEKNLSLLIRAFEAIEAIRPDARLVMVGDGPELPLLRQNHPRFVFRGARRGEDLASHYASADMFLFPSLTETFGNVLLEAMASGLPLVCFDYAAAAEHVKHGSNGLKATFGDDAAFIEAARELIRDPGLRDRDMGRAARESALNLSWEDIFSRFENVLLNIVGESESLQEKALFGLETAP
ncbi:MAG: glycosyltransferase family 1 protein [Pseudomonadota bacterium]